MKRTVALLFLLAAFKGFSQMPPKVGDHAPSFILTLDKDVVQSYVFPYTKRIVMLHFWSSDNYTSRNYGKFLNGLAKRYKNVVYKTAYNFEVIAIAVQKDKKAWREAIISDSLTEFTNGIAPMGYNDDPCRKYGVVALPTDVLMDETGTILAIDPKLSRVEDMLDERKNFQPLRKDVIGTLAQSSNKEEVLKFTKLYLFNIYGDSLGKTTTSSRGVFSFSDIKLNQDFILKVDNQSNIVTSDPVALYTPAGDLLMNGVTSDGGFIFHIPARLSTRLIEFEHTEGGEHLRVLKNLDFNAAGTSLTLNDQKELSSVLSQLERNGKSTVEFTVNTDSKLGDDAAMALTQKQVATITAYFEKKGIAKSRIQGVAKGNDEPRVLCDPPYVCTEKDHRENRRVEFFVHKN